MFKRTPPSEGDSISVYSDSESDRKPGEVLENTIEDFDNFIELHTKFRVPFAEMKDSDKEKKKRNIWWSVAIDPEEDYESVEEGEEEGDAEEVKNRTQKRVRKEE